MRFESLTVPISCIALALCFWNRDRLPQIDATTAIGEPRQLATAESPFAVTYADTDYRIAPEFEYELDGMIVSYRHHEGNSRMHRRAGDHLNMLDVCVVWGSNVSHPDLNELDFWNGIFTCNVNTRSRDAWASFDMNRLSNNHLISDRDDIRRAVQGIRVGDRIRVRGWLASYTGPGGTRGTSTTRSDTGDGACETIYVRDFAVLDRPGNPWRTGLWLAAALLALSLLRHFTRPYRPHAAARA